MNPSGQVAIVTGGGSGLGEATARALAAKGAKVAILDVGHGARRTGRGRDRRHRAANATCRAPRAPKPPSPKSARQLGEPRILVNCAGIAIAHEDDRQGRAAPARHVPQGDRGQSDRHLQHDPPGRRPRAEQLEPLAGGERGVIVNTASVAAYDGQIGQAAYSASKGGVVGMTLPVARDLARSGIRVMTIAPGIFRTPMLAGLPQDVQDSLGAAVPFPPRLGEPAEYAALALHIVENQMLNGETIRLDGAIRMAPK